MSRRPWRALALAYAVAASTLLLGGCTARTAAGTTATVTQVAPASGVPADPAAAPRRTTRPSPSAAPKDTRAPAVPAARRGTGPGGSYLRTGTKAVALTFDDGPDPTLTPQLLDLLQANGIKATFCLVGKQVKLYPELVRRIVADGHTLCDHTYSHSTDLGTQPAAVMVKELQDTLSAIHAAAPGAPVAYFRAPGGNFTPALVSVARTLGMTSIYWAVDPRDWDAITFGTGQRMVDHVLTVVEAKTGPGAIVLSHDYKKPDTIAAYKILLPWLKARFALICLPVATS